MRTTFQRLRQLSDPFDLKNHLLSLAMTRFDSRAFMTAQSQAFNTGRDLKALFPLGAFVMLIGTLILALIAGSAAEPLLLTALAILAVFGTLFLFAIAAGHIEFVRPALKDDLADAVANHYSDALLLALADGRTVWSNQRMGRLLGPTSVGLHAAIEQALGGTPEVAEAMFRLSRAIEHGTARTEDLTVSLTGDAFGDPRGVTVIRLSVKPFEPPGNPGDKTYDQPLVLWSITNISADRVRQQRTTAAMRDALHAYDTMPVGVLTAEAGQPLARINQTMCTLLGYDDPGEVRDHSVTLKDIFSSDGVELITSLANAPAGRMESVDLDLTGKDGTLIPARVICWRTIDDNAAGGESRDDAQISVAALTNTPTENYGAPSSPEHNDKSTARFARFFRSAPFGIATIDKDGRIAHTNASFSRMIVNGAKSHGKEAVKVLSSTADPDTESQIEAGLETVLAGRGKVTPIDITAGKNNEFSRRVYMNPLNNANNPAEAAILYVIDVTEQKSLEAKYAQSQKMDAVGKLAGFVAHDFNNMLTAIIGFSDFLLQTHRPTDAAYSDIINIKSSANRAAGLVAKLLALARQQTLLVEQLQLGEVITDLAPLLKRSVGERIELRLPTGRDLWHVKTDKLQLEQAILNLAVNARDAMPDGGRLTIKTRNVTEREAKRQHRAEMPAAEYVLIDISDTGTGIPPETLAKIFDPFFTTKEAGKGTGLGLATVYGIVKQSGGFVFADSELGKGTSFKIYLPRHIEEPSDKTAPPTGPTGPLPPDPDNDGDITGNERVLLVEDEDVVRSFAVRALQRQGYDVIEAEDGAAALDVLAEVGTVDIVISDVVMPEMDGPTMLKQMRKTHPDLKVIFVSGYPNEAFQKALGEETFAFLPKPFSLPQLAAKVREELDAKPAA